MEKKIEFIVDNTILRGSLFIPSGNGPFPAVIFFHGNGSRALKHFEAGKRLSENGIMAFVFNFRGCGISDGDYLLQTHQDSLIDAKSAYTLLLSQNIDKSRVGVVGGSFGGYIASMMIPQMKIKSLVLLNPSACSHPLSEKIDMGGLANEVEYFKTLSNWENAQGFKNISNYVGQLLFIKSENDENIPPEVLDKYFKSVSHTTKKEMVVIKGADHRLSENVQKEEFFSIIVDWFLKTL